MVVVVAVVAARRQEETRIFMIRAAAAKQNTKSFFCKGTSNLYIYVVPLEGPQRCGLSSGDAINTRNAITCFRPALLRNSTRKHSIQLRGRRHNYTSQLHRVKPHERGEETGVADSAID